MERQMMLAAERGNKTATYVAALNYFYEENYIMAFNYMKRAADMGVVEAIGELGKYYRFGVGTPVNFVKAVKCFKKGEKLADVTCVLQLAECYEQGIAVDRSAKKAVALWQRAAQMGSAVGEYRLGLCFSKGLGVEKNDVEADLHFVISSSVKGQGYGEVNPAQFAYAKTFATV